MAPLPKIFSHLPSLAIILDYRTFDDKYLQEYALER